MINKHIDIGSRLNELKLLKHGWYDGEQGKPLDSEKLDWLTEAFDLFYPDALPLPYLFPTIEGNIQAEWHFVPFNIELDIDLTNQTGICFVMDISKGMKTENDKEFTLNLKEENDWKRLITNLYDSIGIKMRKQV